MSDTYFPIKENIESLLKIAGINAAELCRQTKISPATLNKILAGTTEDPRISTLRAIAVYFKLSVDQVLGLKPLALNNDELAQEENATYIPILSWEDASLWEAQLSSIERNTWRDWSESEVSNKDCFAVEIPDNSMWPQFAENHLLIVAPTETPKHRDFVVAYSPIKKIAVFRQYIISGDNRILKPINKSYEDIVLSEQDKIIGVVIQSKADYKK